MDKVTLLKTRLVEIGRSLAETGEALALLGLGSAGAEQERMDDYSDLDFFVIARPDKKERFIKNLDWLDSIQPIAYAFQNTDAGYKSLFADGVFCEWAVFEPQEMAHISFAAEKLIWAAEDFDRALAVPQTAEPVPPASRPVDWLLGEALTNLYVGLGRFLRGEKMTAVRFVENYALDRVLELMTMLEEPRPVAQDIFQLERRFEQRYPKMAALLPQMVQGYDRVPESAEAILAFLTENFAVNEAIEAEIRKLCQQKRDAK